MTEASRAGLLAEYFAVQDSIDRALSRFDGEEAPEMELRFQNSRRRIDELRAEYLEGIPRVRLSRCPFSGEVLTHSFDPFGLDGIWWEFSAHVRPVENTPSTFFALCGSLKVGTSVEYFPFPCYPGPEAPYVIPRLLEYPAMRAVLSSIKIASHRACAITYFADPITFDIPRVNTWGAIQYVFRGPEGALYRGQRDATTDDLDFELEPWLRSGKLLWIQPGDEKLRLRGDSASCPFLDWNGGRDFQLISNGTIKTAPVSAVIEESKV